MSLYNNSDESGISRDEEGQMSARGQIFRNRPQLMLLKRVTGSLSVRGLAALLDRFVGCVQDARRVRCRSADSAQRLCIFAK